jgi:hypothetical protein
MALALDGTATGIFSGTNTGSVTLTTTGAPGFAVVCVLNEIHRNYADGRYRRSVSAKSHAS